MELVVVERSFPEPVEFFDVQAMEDRFSWCLEMRNVRFLHTYFSADRQRMMCVYEAPDAESVRDANRQAGLPFERVWTATLHKSAK
jgi:hypothetical protein